MIIQVISAGQQSWYNEAIGLTFEAWEHPEEDSVYFISNWHVVLKNDARVVSISEKEKSKKILYN